MNEKVGVILTELENPGRETGTEDKVMISALDILCLTFWRDNLVKFLRIHLEGFAFPGNYHFVFTRTI